MDTKKLFNKATLIVVAIILGAVIIGGAIVFAASVNKPVEPISNATTTQTDAEIPQSVTSQTTQTMQTESLPETSVNANEAQSETYITEEEAKEIAFKHSGVSDATAVYCKLDYDDGIAEFDVEFWSGTTEYEYEINAITGEILSYVYDTDVPMVISQTTNQTTEQNYIGKEKAQEIALQHAGVAQSEVNYIKCEFDFDDGLAEYDVEWKIGQTEYEYTISAIDGTIWEHEVGLDD